MADNPEWWPEPVVVRDRDYYGGDLTVSLEDAWGETHVKIEWRAWGGYGGATITLTLEEGEQVADALKAAADAVPDWYR